MQEKYVLLIFPLNLKVIKRAHLVHLIHEKLEYQGKSIKFEILDTSSLYLKYFVFYINKRQMAIIIFVVSWMDSFEEFKFKIDVSGAEVSGGDSMASLWNPNPSSDKLEPKNRTTHKN